MTLREQVEDLLSRLRNSGFKTNLGPQEHLALENEIVVDINDVKLELESPESYVVDVRVIVNFLARDRLEMLDTIEKLIKICDYGSYKVDDIVINVQGEMVIVTVSVLFREVMEV